jgi:hypothetical protein
MSIFNQLLVDEAKKGNIVSFRNIVKNTLQNAPKTDREIDELYTFLRRAGSETTGTSMTPTGGGGSFSVNGITEAFVQNTGILGRTLSTLSDVVRGVADIGDKIVQTQMGVADPNSSSKKIFDIVKEGGLNPLKLLKSGFTEVINEVTNELTQQSILFSEIGSKTGLVGELGEKLRMDMVEASIEGARYGKNLMEIGSFYTELVSESGKFSLINKDIYDNAIPLAASLNMHLSDLSRVLFDYEKIGVGLNQSIKNLEEATVNSLSLGLSAKKVTETMRSEISKLNEFGFQNGVRGLERMAQKSLEFRMNMNSVFQIADKVFNPEGALDLVANLQVLGGAFGDFNDPIKLMYMATNDVEGLQDALIDAAGSLATYNEEQGRFEITGVNLRRAKAMAQELGISYQELATGAIAAAERTSAATALMSRGLIMDEKDRDFLTNISRMEDGEMKIVVPKSLMDELGGQTELSLEKLTDNQAQVLLRNREAFKEMNTKDIAMSQLTEIQQISRGIDVVASYARVRAAQFLKGTASGLLGDAIKDLKLNVDSFSTQLSQKENVNLSTKVQDFTSNIGQKTKDFFASPLNAINDIADRMTRTFDNNQQTESRTVTTQGTVTHVHEHRVQNGLDAMSRQIIKNDDIISEWMSQVEHEERSYRNPN